MKEELYEIGLNYIKNSMVLNILNIRLDFVREIRNQIINNYNSKRVSLFEVCEDLNLSWINLFLKVPQISNLLTAYLQYLISFRIYEECMGTVKKSGRKPQIAISDIITHAVEIIDEFFPDRQEQEIIVIKTFFEVLAVSCSNIMPEEFFRDNIKFVNGQRVYKNEYIQIYPPKKLEIEINRSVEKIEYELRKDFTPYSIKYNSVKENYLKTLKQFYQMQFVYMLGDCRFGEFYIPPLVLNSRRYRDFLHFEKMDRIGKKRYKSFRDDWKNIFSFNDIIYIVGGPGFGKSLFLRYLVNNITELNLYNCTEYLVIYCDLKTFYTRGKMSKKSVPDFLQESMIAITGIDEEKISKDFIQYYLDVGRCIVLLDALDEVPKEKREELHKKVVAFFSTCSNPNNKICITSRDRGFLPRGEIEVFEICPLTTTDIEEYLDKMILLKKFKKDDKKHFLEQAQILIDKNFLNNFLALSLLVSIYRSENKLPENKTNLYKKCFEYIAKEREIEEKDETGFNWENVAPLMKDSTFISLSTLGVPNNNDVSRKEVEELLLKQYKIKFNDEAKTECAIKEFLEFCSSRTELFVPAATDDKFKFFHRSFFEYFYSRYIHQCSTVEKMYELMVGFDVDSEVFELTVALVKEDNETKYQELVMYLFQKADESLFTENETYIAFNILTLAMQVIDDAFFKQRYFELIIKNYKRLASDGIKDINNMLILTWVINAIQDKDENLELFREAYEEESIVYILGIFSNLSEDQVAKTKLKKAAIQKKAQEGEDVTFTDLSMYEELIGFTDYSLISGITSAPFYVHVYKRYFDVFEKLESYNKTPIKKILESFNMSSRDQYTKIKKGISMYRSFDPDSRMKLCEMIIK